MHRNICVGLLVLVGALTSAQEKLPDAALPRREVRQGELAAVVRSATKPEQSYALYVPTTYSPERRWPVVYVFDPGARGSRPLEVMKAAAERYGYLVAGSNNSRNGSWQVERDAAMEMWSDTHSWLSIDDRRVYFAGFSGGARLSAQLAQMCNCAHGVFLNGAGFNPSDPPSQKAMFPVFSMTGLGDFNYGELVDLDAQLDTLGFRHALRRFDGEHEWAPAGTWEEALAWATLLEMKDGLRDRNSTFVAAELAKAVERLQAREAAGQLWFAVGEYRSAVKTFDGLTDTKELKERVLKLEMNPAVRAGSKQEKGALEKQRNLERQIFSMINRLRDVDANQPLVRAEAVAWIRGLLTEAKKSPPETRLVLHRVLGSVFVMNMETGGPLLEAGRYADAESYFALAAEARPDWAWSHTSLARCHAGMGDRKAALNDLKRAMETGLKVAELEELVKKNPKLAALTETEDYRKIVAGAAATPPQ